MCGGQILFFWMCLITLGARETLLSMEDHGLQNQDQEIRSTINSFGFWPSSTSRMERHFPLGNTQTFLAHVTIEVPRCRDACVDCC
jgi:hypothetical protein